MKAATGCESNCDAKKEDSFALYDKLAALDDPFWSNLAKERREDLNFKMEMEINK